MDADHEIDDIKNTLLEAFDQTNDVNGPNWEHIAQNVYEKHVSRGRKIEAVMESLARVDAKGICCCDDMAEMARAALKET